MSILEFDRTEMENMLIFLENNHNDLDSIVESSYKDLKFLGGNLGKYEDDMKETAIFNIRMCYTYYMKKEDYEKLNELVFLASLVDRPSKCIVDQGVVDAVVINLN